MSYINEKFARMKTSNKHAITCCVFNLSFLKLHVDDSATEFYDYLTSHFLIPLSNKPTKVTNTSQSLMGNILMSKPQGSISGFIEFRITD